MMEECGVVKAQRKILQDGSFWYDCHVDCFFLLPAENLCGKHWQMHFEPSPGPYCPVACLCNGEQEIVERTVREVLFYDEQTRKIPQPTCKKCSTSVLDHKNPPDSGDA